MTTVPGAADTSLTALQPTAVRFLPRAEPLSCGVGATGQFGRWAQCVDLVREHERASGREYAWLFRGRPDVAWLRPLDLRARAQPLQPRRGV